MLATLVAMVFILELLLYIPEVWNYRKALTLLVLCFNFGLSGLIIINLGSWLLTIAFLIVYVFRNINFLRIIKNRVNPQHLRLAAFKTSVILALTTLTILIVSTISFTPASTTIFYYLLSIQLVAALGITTVTAINTYKLGKNYLIGNYSDKELPTVSVCIPARNETQELELCITNLLTSTYPKLEILVLDDCSSDSTPDIIKKFAHDGVRFIKGVQPREDWLPKNQAYKRLVEEASGQYIIFCGVDTRIAPHTVAKLVCLATTNKLAMLSVLPRRLTNNSMAAVIQPMRYWWELAIPRWSSGSSPPVLSTCWLIERKKLEKLGGFEAVKHSVLPERFFAKQCQLRNSYAFIRASELIDVQTNKPVSDQRQTALRVRYPQVHRRPELVMFVSLAVFTFLLLPYGCFIFSLASLNILGLLLSVMAIICNTVTHIIIVTLTNPSNVLIALFNYPVVVITELFLGIESMIRYEFMSVEWKDRNICYPVMHITKSLPKL